MQAGAGGFVQAAYFVEDIHAAAEYWAATWGAGPFLVMEHIPLQNCRYRGTATVLDHSSAYGQYGDLMLELVQQHNPGPSPFRDLYAPGHWGLHHLARFATDLQAELEAYQQRGFATALQAEAGGLAFAFVDTSAQLGHMTELYQDCAQIRDFYALIAKAGGSASAGQTFIELPGE